MRTAVVGDHVGFENGGKPMRSRPAGPPSAEMVAVVGHEIRGPLAAALVYMSIIERKIASGPAGQPVRSALSAAQGEILRTERLVARMIELERLGYAVMHPRRVDLGLVVREAVRRTLVSDPSARINVEAAPCALLGSWDDAAIEQIMQNLLSNALKFGGGRPVRVAFGPFGSGACLVVEDRGAGIAATDRDRIFGRFVRSPAQRSGGLGLGLWLVRQLAEAHRGKVTVHSRRGRGSTFIVTLRPFLPLHTSSATRPSTDSCFFKGAVDPGARRSTRGQGGNP
jgi:signal transduction histidine kinase